MWHGMHYKGFPPLCKFARSLVSFPVCIPSILALVYTFHLECSLGPAFCNLKKIFHVYLLQNGLKCKTYRYQFFLWLWNCSFLDKGYHPLRKFPNIIFRSSRHRIRKYIFLQEKTTSNPLSTFQLLWSKFLMKIKV